MKRWKKVLAAFAGLVLISALTVWAVGPTRLIILAVKHLTKPERVYAVQVGLAARNAEKTSPRPTLFGFTPFPYDSTLEAVTRTHQLIDPNSTLYAIHSDRNGLPWKELLADAPFPRRIQKEWEDDAKAIPKGRVVYLALTPMGLDRQKLAPARGDTDNLPMPPELQGAKINDPRVMRAYLTFVRRVGRMIHPHYLNLGIECGLLMSPKGMDKWHQFAELYRYVRRDLKKSDPSLQIGISFVLQNLRGEAEAKAAREVIRDSDYVGLSFYPYASAFGELFGAPPLGGGADAWRKPLEWVRAYTDKPIALCETGYATKDVRLPQLTLHLHGSEALQTAYTRDLFRIAKRDRYLFVVWFLAVDYDAMFRRAGWAEDNWFGLWRNIGFFDGEVRPKPAWAVWKAGVEESRRTSPSLRRPKR